MFYAIETNLLKIVPIRKKVLETVDANIYLIMLDGNKEKAKNQVDSNTHYGKKIDVNVNFNIFFNDDTIRA